MAHPVQPLPPASLHGAAPPHFGEVRIRNRGRLPHWEKKAGLYFLTFHLADSLPKKVLQKIAERQRILAAAKECGANLLPEQKVLLAEYNRRRMEEYFDRGCGLCALADSRVAGAMAAALRFWHGKRYRLLAWCVMPNHVHVVVKLLPGQELGAVVKGWKLHVARSAKHALGRPGRLWQREYYDRLIRNRDELNRAIQYILENPAKAGLKDWPWVWCSDTETGHTADT